MATGTGEKLTFLRNNERIVAVTESTEQHYEHCANDLNFTHSQSDKHRKEELCETINNLFRQIGHEERLELHLQDSDWRFTIVKVEVIPQSEEGESSNKRRTCEDIRSEIAKIEGDLNDMLLKLKDDKKKIFLSRNDWRSTAYIVAAIQIVLAEVPLSVNPLRLQQFQGQLDEQVGKLLNTEMHCEWSVELFAPFKFVFDNISQLSIRGNTTSFYISGRGNSTILTSDAEEAVTKIVEARSHKARLVYLYIYMFTLKENKHTIHARVLRDFDFGGYNQ